jgi:hypothetical protein
VTSPTLKALESLLPERLLWHRTGHLRHPYLVIDGDWERFYGAAEVSFQEAYQRIQAELKCAGGVRLEEHRTIDPQSPLLQEMLDIVSRGGETSAGPVIATMLRTREFFRELTRRAAKNGWLSVWSLRLNGHLIAIEYQLHADGKVQVLWVGSNPRYQELLPGGALSLSILRLLFEGGYINEYTLGPGVNGDHLWPPTAYHDTVHLQLYRPGSYPHLLYRVETAVTPWARRW